MAVNNIIGGTGANDGKILANSSDDGIEVAGSGTGNAFLRNIIYNNGSMAVDLGGNNSSPTINDFNDTDSGTNGLQNFPMLKSATSAGGNTTSQARSTPPLPDLSRGVLQQRIRASRSNRVRGSTYLPGVNECHDGMPTETQTSAVYSAV